MNWQRGSGPLLAICPKLGCELKISLWTRQGAFSAGKRPAWQALALGFSDTCFSSTTRQPTFQYFVLTASLMPWNDKSAHAIQIYTTAAIAFALYLFLPKVIYCGCVYDVLKCLLHCPHSSLTPPWIVKAWIEWRKTWRFTNIDEWKLEEDASEFLHLVTSAQRRVASSA